jgi:hypothetical protein
MQTVQCTEGAFPIDSNTHGHDHGARAPSARLAVYHPLPMCLIHTHIAPQNLRNTICRPSAYKTLIQTIRMTMTGHSRDAAIWVTSVLHPQCIRLPWMTSYTRFKTGDRKTHSRKGAACDHPRPCLSRVDRCRFLIVRGACIISI